MLESLTAYAGLFVWSFLAATLLPIGSEMALVVLVRSEQQTIAPVLVATVGNYLGACTTYWIARNAAQSLGKNRQGEMTERTRAARLMHRFGQPALLLSWVPLVGDALVALAGAMRLPFIPFSLWTILGKAARYAAVAWAAQAV